MLRTYIYVSKSKVDMLYGQLRKDVREKINAKLAFHLGVVSGEMSSEVPANDSVIGQAQIVAKALDEDRSLGKLYSSDKDWVEDEFPARAVILPQNPNVFLLAGTAEDRAIVLAGSASNVISGPPAEKVTLGYSYLPYLAEELTGSLNYFEHETERQTKLRTGLVGDHALDTAVRDHELADVVEALVYRFVNK